ncbi:hypothetical protein E1B22_00240 [Thermaerobacter sp. FW80]|uniref:hydantoinase B/oxoprolinase family protein n=1 Tax=Thermaerobacter sp. FW80 TaxID=2546351 RepID=UPI001075042A|nr:hydantoinase B/oxoprolinase family protein [Thermaerobacter sp. FW80]QBS36577.1 hypothetical protein E1B22_00240 [Thermaerobacter sp. FW80]
MSVATGSLRQMLEDVRRKTQETGYYAGLRELPLRQENPFRWEEALAKLVAATVTAREVAVHIAASPITRSLNETCFALFTPDGDAVALSTGIIVHVHTMSEDIKQMIEAGYEEFPGIRDGDIFSNNDPALGNVHTTDIHTLIPIFYEPVSRTQVFPQDCTHVGLSEAMDWNSPSPEVSLWPTTSAR